MNEETKARLREILAELRERQTDKSLGICWHVQEAVYILDVECEQAHEINRWVRDTMQTWPKKSEYKYYPVPDGDMDPEVASDTTEDLWDTNTEYGRNRFELLDFLIQEAEKI